MMKRRMTGRMKAAVSALLVSSMVLNPWYGIDLAIGAEKSSTGISVSGLTGSSVKVNLESSSLRQEALNAIRESEPVEFERFLSTDADTDAAFENLLKDPNPYYTVNIWTADDEALFEEEGISVQILVQKDLSGEEAEEIAKASNLKKTGVRFDANVKNRKDKEIVFYPEGGTLDNLIADFQTDELIHDSALDEEETAIEMDDSDYMLTGEEKITILYMNTGKKSHSFKLSIDGKSYASSVKVAGTNSAAKSVFNKLKAIMKGEDTTEEQTLEAATVNVSESASAAEAAETEKFEAKADSEQKEAAAETVETAEEAKKDATEPELQNGDGDSTTIRMGAFTLDRFLDEAETEEVKTAEKEEEPESKEEKTDEVKDTKETEAKEAAASAEIASEASEENTTEDVKEEKETAAESAAETAESSTAADTESVAAANAKTSAAAAETTAVAETKAATASEIGRPLTAMDESLAAEQKALLQELSAEDIAGELKSAKVVQYTLGDLTDEFLSATLTDADGNDAYIVRAYPIDDDSIGEGWTLHATEVVREGEEAQTAEESTEMDEAVKEALEANDLYDHSASLDIYFEDQDGNEVEPNGAVRVEIEVSTAVLPEDVDPDTMKIYHLEENDGEITKVAKVAASGDVKALDSEGETISKKEAVVTEIAAVDEETETGETAAAEASTTEAKRFSDEVAAVKASFEVKSFSTFTISWNGRDYILEGSTENYKVKITYNGAAKLPEDVSLELTEIDPASEQYQELVEKATEKVQTEKPEVQSIDSTGFVDISLMSGTEEIEPANIVSVEVTPKTALSLEETVSMEAVHFESDGVALLESTLKKETDSTVLSFETDSFSIYGFIGTHTGTKPVTNNYVITVSEDGTRADTVELYYYDTTAEGETRDNGQGEWKSSDTGVVTVERDEELQKPVVPDGQKLRDGLDINKITSSAKITAKKKSDDTVTITYTSNNLKNEDGSPKKETYSVKVIRRGNLEWSRTTEGHKNVGSLVKIPQNKLYGSSNVWKWSDVKDLNTNTKDFQKVWDGNYNRNYDYINDYLDNKNNMERVDEETATSTTFSYATWWHDVKGSNTEAATMRRFRAEYTIPKGMDSSDTYKLVSTGADAEKKYLPINDAMYVFVYPKYSTNENGEEVETELTDDNYMNYLAFWTSTQNSEAVQYFGNKNGTKSYHYTGNAKQFKFTDQWCCDAVDDNLGATMFANAPDAEAGTVFVIDVFAADYYDGGAMSEMEVQADANGLGSYVINYYYGSVDAKNLLDSEVTKKVAEGTYSFADKVNAKKSNAVEKNGGFSCSDGAVVSATATFDGEKDETLAGKAVSEKKIYMIQDGHRTAKGHFVINVVYTPEIPVPTGFRSDVMPYVLTVGVALAGAALILLETARRRRYAER